MPMIDTLAFAKRLREAGADGRLAEAIVSGVSEARGELATKADLAVLEIRLTQLIYGFVLGGVAAIFAGQFAAVQALLGFLSP